MDLKFLAVALIFVVALFIYARTMRVHVHASWGEIFFPWLRDRAKLKQQERHGGAAPAE